MITTLGRWYHTDAVPTWIFPRTLGVGFYSPVVLFVYSEGTVIAGFVPRQEIVGSREKDTLYVPFAIHPPFRVVAQESPAICGIEIPPY
jgi:hypothetical protein